MDVDTETVIGVIGVIVGIVVLFVMLGACLDLRREHMTAGSKAKYFSFTVHLLLPTFDLFSDIAYFLTSKLASLLILTAMPLFYVVPVGLFVRRLIKYRAYPRAFYVPRRFIFLCAAKYSFRGPPYTVKSAGDHWIISPHYYCDAWSNANSNSRGISDQPVAPEGGTTPPYELADGCKNRKRCLLASVEFVQLGGCLFNIVLWALYVILQIVYVVLMVVVVAVQLLALTLVWSILGVVLFWTKADAIGGVWSLWFYVWTAGNEEFVAEFETPDLVIDTAVLNGTLFMHFLWEAVPHLIIQSYNNNAVHEPWTALKILSVMSSVYQIVAGIYTFIYLRYGCLWGIERVPLENIPQTLSCGCFDLVKLPPAKKIKPLPYSDATNRLQYLRN